MAFWGILVSFCRVGIKVMNVAPKETFCQTFHTIDFFQYRRKINFCWEVESGSDEFLIFALVVSRLAAARVFVVRCLRSD